jgi:hypothetical protein
MRAVQGLEDSARFCLSEARPPFSMGVLLTATFVFLDEAWISPISKSVSVITPSPFHAVLRGTGLFCPAAHCEFHAEEAICPFGIPPC